MKSPFIPPSLAGAAVSLWTAGGWLRAQLYQKGIFRQRRLGTKVISIGNITFGGTGKTPFTLWLAGRLQAAGLRVSILTRGYGRTSSDRVKFLLPGASPLDAREDGDEVQLYLRHLKIPIGIAAQRYEAGRLLEQRFSLDVHLLDDGFQHWGLARDIDLVLIDASNPWGSRDGFGRLLREAPRALRRAHAILLTRSELANNIENGSRRLEDLQATLQKINPDAPQFTVQTKLVHFVDHQGKFPVPCAPIRARRAVAFCGLGNPDNFFSMLLMADIKVVSSKAFPDHHRYGVDDLRLLETLVRENQAECLLTTEKDLVNLPQGASFSVPFYWAAIELAVDQEARLLKWIGEKLGFPAERLSSSVPSTDPVVDRSVAAIL